MPNRENAMLILQRGNQTGRSYPLDQPELVIGRSPDCDIFLDDRQVSRRHARVFREGDRFMVEDLGSKNSTHLNGRDLEGVTPLQDGDEIQIALRFKLAFVDAEQTAPLVFDQPPLAPVLHLEPDTRQVLVGERSLNPPLSLPQYRLLELLLQAAGGVVSREEVIHYVWPEDAEEGISEQAIDALVRRLRERLAELDPGHAYVLTVRGHGFRFQNREAASDQLRPANVKP
ncbi:FHA domain-containing protein [Candidatus Amarolinea aalborgensis]|jgi:DNA-binding winged helix-turn-helix (wHTH) protein|uniref:FHA domain-containing protein n=1 Tax=Candidatus Amarolinea aalborgensis TaxID=2249329 RepID=UPI003BF9E484